MKTVALAVASALAIAPAFAQWDGPYQNRDRAYSYQRDDRPAYQESYARVIESTPVYASNTEECWNPRTQAYEARRDSRSGIGAGTAVGAVAGGVLGHQVGDDAGTAVGAILGGIIGHQIEKDRNRSDDLDLSRCRYASDTSNVQAYDVRYRYQGQEYVTRMSYDPGNRLLVGTDINWDGTPMG
jgi:uncharacterized protein YcfJ